MTIQSKLDPKTVVALPSQKAASGIDMKRNKPANLKPEVQAPSNRLKSFKDQIEERYEQVLNRKLEVEAAPKKISEPIETIRLNQMQDLPDYIKDIGFNIEDFAMPSREQIALKVKQAQEKMSIEKRESIQGKNASSFYASLPRGGGPLPKPKKG